VLVVEHDEEAIRAADYVVDMGPGAGVHGGEVVAEGTPEEIRMSEASLTGQFLSGRRRIAIPEQRRQPDAERQLVVTHASGNNLKNVTLNLPVGLFVCITGVSGSGKSTLINDTLYAAVARHLYGSSTEPAPHGEIRGLEFFDKVINVDQSPIGRTPRSNPATYTGLFTPIRELFAGVPEARARGYGPGRFSFNVKGGRCEACQGDGVIKVEMHFLPDVYVPCDVCHGARYNRETLEILYKGKTIRDVLEMTIEHAHEFFAVVPVVRRKLQTLLDVGSGLHPPRPVRQPRCRRRGAARQARARTQQTRHRAHPLHPRRAHHGSPFRRHRPAAERAAAPVRSRQQRGRHRTQPGCDQDRRLADRPRPRRRRRRRADHRRRHARGSGGHPASHTGQYLQPVLSRH